MPKILESIREQLLETARRQIGKNGYGSTTIRSVASECGIAVGTVYNYFPSKDVLIATVVSEDWLGCLASIASEREDDPRTHLKRIYDALSAFSQRYQTLFSDADAEKSYRAVFAERHRQLRAQLAALIAPVLHDAPDAAFRSEFLAQSLLTWTLEGKPFDALYGVMQHLIK